jgi:acyl dehydratase
MQELRMGLYFEEFEVGAKIEHPFRRTVSEYDNILFSTLTLNPQPLHLDAEFSAGTFYGQRLVNSLFTLGLVAGMTVSGMTIGTTLGHLGMTDVEFPSPVFHGDTLRTVTTILDKRESRSRPDTGIVSFHRVGYNQRDEVVCEFKQAILMKKTPVI